MAASDHLSAITNALRPVRELEEALEPRGVSARTLLAAYGIPIVDEHYSSLALERAVAGLAQNAAAPPRPAIDVPTDPIAVLGKVLARGGVNIVTKSKSKGWHVTVATSKPRLLMTEEFEDDVDYPCPPISIGKAPVGGRVYFVRTRHSGGAYFVASNIADGPPLHFFVLLLEGRVWAAGRDVLQAFLTEATVARRDFDENIKNVRFAVFDRAPNALRVWFPKGDTSFDLRAQLRDAQRQHVLRPGADRAQPTGQTPRSSSPEPSASGKKPHGRTRR